MNDNHLQGAFPEMTNEQHHSHPAIGSSGLKLIGQSPLHYWAAYRDPNRVKREPTPAMKIGSATHTGVLEPHTFDERYTVMPEGLDRRTKEGKEVYNQILASGKDFLSQDDMARIKAMAEAAHRHPVTRVLFDRPECKTEVSIFWVDPITGVNCKIRPDLMIEPCGMFPNGLIADLKTTDDASPEEFSRSVWNWEMHLQAALYPEGFMAVFGTKAPPDFLWLAQEKDAPFANKYYSCSPDLAAYGRKQVHHLRSIYAECLRKDQWPAYGNEVQPIALPGWADKIVQDALAA